MSVIFPTSMVGFRVRRRVSRSEEEVVGPTFTPMGLEMPRKNSMCAPSIWRVRSPTQMKCAEVSYQDFWSSAALGMSGDEGVMVEVEGSLRRRVRRCSYSRRRPSWLV